MPRFFPALQVSLELFRGPQPDFEDMLHLKSHGVRALVNLRREATESEFFARQAGLEYLHLAVEDWNIPQEGQIREFLQFLNIPQNQPALIHCAMGVGRTGTFVACYRVAKGMTADDAIRMTNDESPLRGVTMNRLQQDFVRSFRP